MITTRLSAGRLTIVGTAISALVALLTIPAPVAAQRATWSFDDLPVGAPPPGFLFASSPRSQAAQWTVMRDGPNAVLGRLRRGQPGIQLAIVDGPSYLDVVLSVRVRLLEGAQSAGLVWRYRDTDNYFLARLDLREQDVRIYRVVAGNRTRLESEDDLELEAGSWHVLKVEHRGARMRLLINGVPVGEACDRTWQEAGAVGLWTTSDSAAWFDDLTVEPAGRGRSDRQD